MTATTDGTLERDMILIQGLDNDAHLRFSNFTNGWHIAANIEIGDGHTLSSVTEHRDTPQEAVSAYVRRLQEVQRPRFLVTNANRDSRREWRWNGHLWTDVTRPQ